MSGVTTLVDLSVAHDGWIDLMAAKRHPRRARRRCTATRAGTPTTATWCNTSGTRPPDAARWRPRSASSQAAERHPSGRLSGMVIPSQIDTCSAELFRDSHAEALRLKVPFQTHAAQSIVEFHEMTRRHGMTPIEWLDSLGVLGPTSIIGHGIFLDHHSATSWPKRDDLCDHHRARRDGRALPDRVHPPRHHDADGRRLHPARREDRHRHRHLSAQHDRGDAPRALCVAHRREERVRPAHQRHLQRRDARRRGGAAARRHRPARARRQGRPGDGRRHRARRCGRCATRSRA